MYQNVKKLIVKYNGKTVGYLAELENKKIAFQYDDAWLKDGFSISPFSLPLTDEIFISKDNTFGGLFGVFRDSLPDGWGELLVRRMLSKKGINPDRLSPLDKLTLISGNGLGALTYEPSKFNENEDEIFNLDEFSKEVKKILADETDGVNLDQVFKFGGASGGARPKAHIRSNDEYWIVKFPCALDPQNIGELEFKANELAKTCGINVNEFKLFKSNFCSGYFGAKRFDRKGDTRVHMVSLSALLETSHQIPNLDYLHLFQVIEAICVDKADIVEAYRRMCFNVYFKNRDDHGKNFAFLYDENKGGYKLSPAYDITALPEKAEHEMTVNGSGKPTDADLLEVAKIIKLPQAKAKSIINKVKTTLLG